MTETLTVIEPATEQPLDELPRAGVEETDAAVARAAEALPAWRALAPSARSAILRDLVTALEDAHEELATLEARNAGKPLGAICTCSATLQSALDNGLANNWGYTGQNIELKRQDGQVLHLNCTVTPLRPDVAAGVRLLLELQPIEHHLAATREERLIEQQQASRELIRNLAHEIKNPLGGIRGAAQLLGVRAG